jgi:hypothetical protein
MAMSAQLLGLSVVVMASLLLPSPARAARPLVTEDASILLPGFCQLETWAQHNEGNTDYWAAPHCNVGGQWELIAGLGQLGAPANGGARSQRVFRAKTLLRPMDRNGLSIGLVLSDQFGAGDSVAGDLSVTVPLSLALPGRRVLVHANAGWVRRHDGPNGMTWALAGEWNLAPGAGLTLEAYGAGHDHGYMQLGARYDLVPRQVTLDAAIGNRFGLHRAGRYLSIGLTVTAGVLR